MGFADSLAGRLFLVRRKSDLEFKVQTIMSRKLAVLDECNSISAQLSNSIFQTDQNSLISPGAALPGFVAPSPYNPAITIPGADTGTGVLEQQLGYLQSLEKELDIRQKKLETELEAVKAEEESLKKIAMDHAKKDFKIG